MKIRGYQNTQADKHGIVSLARANSFKSNLKQSSEFL